MKKLLITLIIFAVLAPALFGQDEHILTVRTVPHGAIPVGSSTTLFNFGFGTEAGASFFPSFLGSVGIGMGADFSFLPVETADSIWTVGIGAGPALRVPLGKRFSVNAFGNFGYYYWSPIGWDTGDGNGGSFYMKAGAGAEFAVAGPFALGLGASYDYMGKLYNGFGFSLSLKMVFPVKSASRTGTVPGTMQPQTLGEGKGAGLEDITLTQLFPVLYKYYDNSPVGTARVINYEKVPIEDIKVKFYVERYMDNPMESGKTFDLGPGEEKTISLLGLFTEDLMEITEGTKASAKITVSFVMEGQSYEAEYNPVLEFYNRNALMWDDDRKIASFITAKDPTVLSFSKNVMTWMKEVENPAVDENLQKGMALFDAVQAYGIRYEIDPATPFSELSQEKTVVDFLQFPRQTLEYTNGDCDDLSALYTALLEAVGVETAVITIPGHIYTAFALKADPDEARAVFSRPDELVFRENKAWVPVEITMFQESFAKAWQTGAKEWRENASKEQSMLYPTRDSWQTYQAVGFKESSAAISLPDKDQVQAAFKDSLARHIDQEIYPQVARIQAKIDSSNTKHKYRNKLAVLYARYGLYSRALETFQEIISTIEYKPALNNLGNIHFIRDEYKDALGCYQRVLALDRDNKTALLGVSRCNHELENYGLVGDTFDRLKTLSPDTAARFAYLDLRGEEAVRAADAAGLRDTVIWEEED